MEKFSTEYFHKLANDLKFDLSDEEIEKFVTMTLPTGGVQRTPYTVTAELLTDIYRHLTV